MEEKPDSKISSDDTLCDHCANKPECNEHHMMCVNFEPADDNSIHEPQQKNEA